MTDKGDGEKVDASTSQAAGALDVAVDFGKSLVQSAVISPLWNGLGQLASGGRLPQVSIVNEENAKHSSADAWAQKIGGASGMALDLFLVTMATKGGAADSAAETAAGRLGGSVTSGEAAMARLGQGLKSGALYGGFFVPSEKGDNLVFGRLKNAAVNGITFGAMGGISEAVGSIGVLGKIKPSTLAYAIKDMGVTGLVGLPTGAITAESDAIINHHTTAGWQEIKSQATDYGVIGVVLTGLTHGTAAMAGARSSSVPLARQEVQTPQSSIALGAIAKAGSGAVEAMPPFAYGDLRGGSRASTASAEHGGAPTTVLHDTVAGRIQISTYPDKTVVEHHIDSDIKITTLPDQTVITDSRNGVRTERPDGSETNVTAYRTENRSPEGKWTFHYNRWTKAWENWENLSHDQKSHALTDLDQIPPRGNLVANLVQKGFGESHPDLQEKAFAGLRYIRDGDEQTNQWSLARNYNPAFAARLIDLLPQLQPESRQRILSGHGASLGDVYSGLVEKQQAAASQQPSVDAAYDYLDMVHDFPKSVRKSIWDQINDTLDPEKKKFDRQTLLPLAREIITAVRGGDPVATQAFGEFAKLPTANLRPYEHLQTDRPTRMKIAGSKVNQQVADHIKQTLLTADQQYAQGGGWEAMRDAESEVRRLLNDNPDVGLHKSIYDWANSEGTESIKDFIKDEMSTGRRITRLVDEYRRLAAADPLPSRFNFLQAHEAPDALRERAKEYHITDDQIAATLENSVQLMQIADANRDTRGNITRAGNQFRMAGLQTMLQAGDPYLIVQGQHNTCAMAQLEFSTFMKNPDEASRLINQVMRKGTYATQDGTTIKIDPTSLRPQDVSLELNHTREEQNYSYRSYASQIFQTAAANIHWQRQTSLPDGYPVSPGSVKYHLEYQDAWDNNGNYLGKRPNEALLYHAPDSDYLLRNSPYIYSLLQLEDIGLQLAGERTKPSVATVLPSDEAAFGQYLKSLPYPESFPLIIGVDADILSNPTKTPGQPNHAISIVTPFQGGQKVYFHNTWLPGDRVANFRNRYLFWSMTDH